MWVRELELVDYRSYRTATLTAGPGAVVLVGPNGQGKTNVVEAIAYASALDSHRVHTDAALVRSGAERAVIRVVAEAKGRTITVELELNPGRANRARVNGQPVQRMRDVVGELRCCLFAPEHLRLVKGEPADRRRFVDQVMTQVAPRYWAVRSDFERVVRQRNAALRTLVATPSTQAEAVLAAWDDRYVPIAVELTWGRLNAVRLLAGSVAAAYREIAPTEDDVALWYDSAAPDLAACTSKEELAAVLAASLREQHADEVRRGVTLVGPHRDDLAMTLNGQPAKTFASHGESWSLALALQLSSFHVLADIADDPPVLILDDVFAELDVMRRERLLAAVTAAEQVIVTAAVEADVPAALAGQRVQVTRADGDSRLVLPAPGAAAGPAHVGAES